MLIKKKEYFMIILLIIVAYILSYTRCLYRQDKYFILVNKGDGLHTTQNHKSKINKNLFYLLQ